MSVTSMRSFVLLVPVLAGAVACGGSNQPSNNPQQCPPGYSFDGRGCVALAAPPPSTPVPGPDAGAAPADAAAPSKNAKALDPAAASAATQLIGPAAQAAAPAGAK